MRYLFIDRDGTLLYEPPDTQQIDSYEKFRLLPSVLSTLRWACQMGYRLVLISNQDGLGTPAFPEEAFRGPQELFLELCASEGITWYGVHIDRSWGRQPSFFRKPSPLLLLPYVEAGLDRERSFVIGDRATDMQLAQRLGLKGLWLWNPLHGYPEAYPHAQQVHSWTEIQRILESALFKTHLVRQTRETAIQLTLTLYGHPPTATLQTGLGFLDHMLELLAYHAGWELHLQATGDLWVDAHHTVEDVAIALGQALLQLQQDKRGITRYGQSYDGEASIWRTLPMDEALALVAIDLSGRGLCTWQVALPDGVGGLPTSLWAHFFDTLAREARLTLHLWARGYDGHHTLEALFKGTGRALREAFRRSYAELTVPSTKGQL